MAQTPGFQMLFENLEQIGFFEFFLPLILFMAIFYGLLRKSEVIGDDDGVIAAASLALSFITVFGIYTFVPFTFFPQFFGLLSLIIVGVLGLVLIAGMVGFEFNEDPDPRLQYGILGTAVLIALFSLPALFGEFFNAGGITIEWGGLDEMAYNFLLTLALIGVMGGVVWSLTRPE